VKIAVILLAMRAATMGSRFLLLLLLSALFPAAEMAEVAAVYVLSAAVAGIAGLELHRDLGRRYVLAAPADRPRLFRDHFLLLSMAAMLAGAAMLPLSHFGFFSPQHLGLVGAIVFLQVINNDVTRFFYFQGRPVMCNFHMLTATGAWIAIFAPLVLMVPALRTAQWVFTFWLGSSLCGLLFLLALTKRGEWGRMIGAPLQRSALIRHVTVAWAPFVAAIAVTLAVSVDRLVLRLIDQPHALNAMFVHVSVLQVTSIVIDVVLAQRLYPRLVRLGVNRNAFRRGLRPVLRTALLIGVAVAPLLGLISFVLGRTYQNLAIEHDVAVVALLTLAFIFDSLAVQMIHNAYALRLDRPLAAVAIADLVFTAAASFVLLPLYGPLGAAMVWLSRGILRAGSYGILLWSAVRTR
jgi:hypothetical protein